MTQPKKPSQLAQRALQAAHFVGIAKASAQKPRTQAAKPAATTSPKTVQDFSHLAAIACPAPVPSASNASSTPKHQTKKTATRGMDDAFATVKGAAKPDPKTLTSFDREMAKATRK